MFLGRRFVIEVIRELDRGLPSAAVLSLHEADEVGG